MTAPAEGKPAPAAPPVWVVTVKVRGSPDPQLVADILSELVEEQRIKNKPAA